MKNILTKIKINETTYFLIFLFLITGHIKNILLILLIIVFHELGHIFFLRIFKYQIIKVEFLPFGGITKTEKLINTPINHDLMIYVAGIMFQIILEIIFIYILKEGFIYLTTYNLFKKYNHAIMIFNILPIRPLDGGEILRLLLEKKLAFFKAQKIINVLSLVFLGIFFFINIKFNLNNYVIISFLFFKIYNILKNEKYILNKFFLERSLYDLPYNKISNDKMKNIKNLKKETFHYFWHKNRYISEKELLRQKFDINTYF